LEENKHSNLINYISTLKFRRRPLKK